MLCADTTVALGPPHPWQAGKRGRGGSEFLLKLSGRRHRVITAVAVKRGDRFWQRSVETVVKVKALSDVEINAYLASGEWQGKGGGLRHSGPLRRLHPLASGLLHRGRRPAGRRDRASSGSGGDRHTRCGGMKRPGRRPWDNIKGREAAALIVDGQLQDLLIEAGIDHRLCPRRYLARGARPADEGSGRRFRETAGRAERVSCARRKGSPPVSRSLSRFRDSPSRARHCRSRRV